MKKEKMALSTKLFILTLTMLAVSILAAIISIIVRIVDFVNKINSTSINVIGEYNEELILKDVVIPDPAISLKELYIILHNDTDQPIYVGSTVKGYFIFDDHTKNYDKIDTGELEYLSPHSDGVIHVSVWTPGYFPDGYDVELEWDYTDYNPCKDVSNIGVYTKKMNGNTYVILDNESDELACNGPFDAYVILYKKKGKIKAIEHKVITKDLDIFSSTAVYIPVVDKSYNTADTIIQK